MAKKRKGLSVSDSLTAAMVGVENQIARAMERSPEERSMSGVQKWEPLQRKTEEIAALVMNNLADEEIGLDSLLVFSQAMNKALYLFCEEVGLEGLGEMRRAYCVHAAEAGLRDSERTLQCLQSSEGGSTRLN